MIKCEIRWVVIYFFVNYITSINGRSWDVAVTIGQEINFFSSNATMTGRVINRDAISLTAIAYDDITRTIFLGDKRNEKTSIFYKNLDPKNVKWNTLLNNVKKNSHIVGIIWDKLTKNLIYMDSNKHSIMKIENLSSKPTEILKLPNQSLRGIAMDTCSRKFYWANSHESNASISICDFDGSNIKIIVQSNLYDPSALTIDQTNGKLYWIDDEEGIHYKIESSELDGTNRKLLVHGKHLQPVSIAVDSEFVYWADWTYSAIWRIKKNPKAGDLPVQWYSFYTSNLDSEPTDIVTRDNIHSLDCNLREKLQNDAKRLKNQIDMDKNEGLDTSSEDESETNKNTSFCLNEGQFIINNNTCLCKNGFVGSHCEISICLNYCLQGECIVTADNQPHCKCQPMFQGQRCEQNICSGYCLNDGKCSIKNGEPYCNCTTTNGTRCELTTINFEENCQNYCTNNTQKLSDIEKTLCRCPKINATETLHRTYSDKMWNNALITTLSVIIGILTILVITLGAFVNKLRQRPRIKKRFIVSKNGITPLTTRPELPRDQCEIMIENCCNMNICETPCFEPQTRSDTKKSKKEEKHSLIDSMDGNNSC